MAEARSYKKLTEESEDQLGGGKSTQNRCAHLREHMVPDKCFHMFAQCAWSGTKADASTALILNQCC